MRRRATLISVLVLLQLVSFHSAPTAAFTPEAISQLSNLAQDAISSGSFLDLSQYGLSNRGISSKLYAWLQQALVDVFNMDEGTLTSLASNLFSGSGSNLASAGVAAVTGGLAGALTGGAAGAWRECTDFMGPGGPPQPPPLPPLPAKHPLAPWATKHDKALHVLAGAWTSALVKAQFNPGLQSMLKITGLDEMQERPPHPEPSWEVSLLSPLLQLPGVDMWLREQWEGGTSRWLKFWLLLMVAMAILAAVSRFGSRWIVTVLINMLPVNT